MNILAQTAPTAPVPAAPAADAAPAPVETITTAAPAAADAPVPAELPIPMEAATTTVPGQGTMEVVSTSDPVQVAAEAVSAANVPSPVIFMLGVFMMGLFLWYFGTESARKKRLIGTGLTIAVALGSWWFFDSIGIRKGIEIQGGIAMTIRIDPGMNEDGEIKPVTPEAQQQAIKVLQRRLDSLGTSDISISPQGEDQIFLQIPGVGEERRREIQDTLAKVARLDFALVNSDPANQARVPGVLAGADVIPGFHVIPYAQEEDENGEPLPNRGFELVPLRPDMAGKHVSSANYTYGPEGDAISVSFDGEGSKIMAALTNNNVNRQLAIIMDGEILSAPNINEPFSSGCLITGNFSQKSATALASALENPLENPIKIESSSVISPTMGKETIRQGVMAGVAGLFLTLIFIAFYYRFAGLVAMVGLSVNVLMIFGAMALFKFTLTLPGIAGIILTIGIAIDSNVLIYERLREELAAGKTLAAAIATAYQKAFSAIFDANITSLITSVILFIVATGTVRGFAVTLTIGILSSLFAALLVTRVCFNWATDTGFTKKLTFLNFSPDKSFDFLSRRRACLIGSLILLVISVIVVPTIDPRGVDLKGGDLLTIHSPKGLSVPIIREALAKADLGKEPIVQSQTPVGSEGEFYTVRSDFGTAPAAIAAIESHIGVKLAETSTDSIGSAVGSEMLRTSIIALGLGLLGILLYVTVRYEFAFALGAIVALFHDLVISMGILTLMGQEFSLITVGALLTIAGYSINDTIVVFDRVREGLATKRGEVKDVMNYSLNATLSRTILTGVTTLLTVVTLLIFGGPALSNFAWALLVGILVGTYSSIYIASPIVLWWARKSGTNLRREVLDTEAARIDVGPNANSKA